MKLGKFRLTQDYDNLFTKDIYHTFIYPDIPNNNNLYNGFVYTHNKNNIHLCNHSYLGYVCNVDISSIIKVKNINPLYGELAANIVYFSFIQNKHILIYDNMKNYISTNPYNNRTLLLNYDILKNPNINIVNDILRCGLLPQPPIHYLNKDEFRINYLSNLVNKDLSILLDQSWNHNNEILKPNSLLYQKYFNNSQLNEFLASFGK